MNYLTVFVGGGLGSLARFLVGIFIAKSKISSFPVATFISNVMACTILAIMVFHFKSKLTQISWLSPLIITGFCGGFSTFSSFSHETNLLFQQGNYIYAVLNILISIVFCVGIFFILEK